MKNELLQATIDQLKRKSREEKVNIWRRIALDLESPTRNRRVVNLAKIDRFTEANETIVVPGKVLGTGTLSHKVTVAALGYSDQALGKLKEASAEAVSLLELAERNPKGKDIRIIG
ncbi:50S ribosomal protein L18e [Candidatus Woesearchaeota archaeon]|nr:50S ribosomal protein L18e [Candidatus Woesearchaeota archaeon]